MKHEEGCYFPKHCWGFQQARLEMSLWCFPGRPSFHMLLTWIAHRGSSIWVGNPCVLFNYMWMFAQNWNKWYSIACTSLQFGSVFSQTERIYWQTVFLWFKNHSCPPTIRFKAKAFLNLHEIQSFIFTLFDSFMLPSTVSSPCMTSVHHHLVTFNVLSFIQASSARRPRN